MTPVTLILLMKAQDSRCVGQGGTLVGQDGVTDDALVFHIETFLCCVVSISLT